MTSTTAVPDSPVLPAARRPPLRLYLTGRAAGLMLTSLAGAVTFSLWITAVAISPITVCAPLVLPATALVRAYANARRRGVERLIGGPVRVTYRQSRRPGMISRVWAIVRDRASWRDALWCLVHSIVGCVTSALTVALFLGGVFYVIYPFLFWVTPQRAFGRPFGGVLELHTVTQAAVMTPLALVSFGLWYVLVLPLARVEIGLTRRLLGPR